MLSDEQEGQFWEFYRKTSEPLFRKAYRMCRGQRADADDAHQNSYLKALAHWPTLSCLSDKQRQSWMATTLTREVLQLWRKPHRSHETGDVGPPIDDRWRQAEAGIGVDTDTQGEVDRYRQVCRAIAQLDGREREVIALHCLAGYEISEVADMLEVSQSTIRVHLHRGRQALLKLLAGEEDTAHD